MTPTATPDLAHLGAGFTDEALDSQAVFRHVLHALSHPGRPVTVAASAQWPQVTGALCHPTSAAVLLALLDAETTLWLSPGLAHTAAQSWLRFHTGCAIATHPSQAQFIWAESLSALPDLAELACGTDADPDQAATCVVDVPAFSTDTDHARWTLSGPGVPQPLPLALPGLELAQCQRFEDLRRANHALFPRGVDVLLATAQQVLGLPRTTQLSPVAQPTPSPQET